VAERFGGKVSAMQREGTQETHSSSLCSDAQGNSSCQCRLRWLFSTSEALHMALYKYDYSCLLSTGLFRFWSDRTQLSVFELLEFTAESVFRHVLKTL